MDRFGPIWSENPDFSIFCGAYFQKEGRSDIFTPKVHVVVVHILGLFETSMKYFGFYGQSLIWGKFGQARYDSEMC